MSADAAQLAHDLREDDLVMTGRLVAHLIGDETWHPVAVMGWENTKLLADLLEVIGATSFLDDDTELRRWRNQIFDVLAEAER